MTFPARNSPLPSWQWGVPPPPLHLFMFIHAQKVSLYLTSDPFASPFCQPAIWPPAPPCYLCLLSHPRLGHPLFSYRCLSHTNTPCAPAAVVGSAEPLMESHRGGQEPRAGKSHSRNLGCASSRDTFVTTAKHSSLPVATAAACSSLPTCDQASEEITVGCLSVQ